MSATITPFQDCIKKYLEQRASQDAQFAESYGKPGKSLEECCKYIMQEVKKLADKNAEATVKMKQGVGCAIPDEVVFGLAVHYYDEDDVKVDANAPVAVVTTPPAVQEPAPAEPAAEKVVPAKPKRGRKKADPNIPAPLEIPLF